ncbi:50S ribosomal protein L23 [Sediminitomix flava]|uniref:Large ribosomal subunit protein uL23 n=1 Tax=Sediminitomix flava TaxID=379075 RepID=A0A315ZEB4_SEDFL|nr:50S ribosomal protein L23 [Sediminitomix flava]PWJ43074.1 large subunit ribosomal protein L23 [Sediminitomix flava]
MQILIKPLVTEKIAEMNENGVYGFVVNKNANKIQIKQAIEAKYGVTVEKVNTVIMPAERKVKYTKTAILEGRTSAYKKAYVTVAEGDIIDVYENL